MLEICANNIHLMLIKNEQKYVNSLYISRKELKTVHKKIKAISIAKTVFLASITLHLRSDFLIRKSEFKFKNIYHLNPPSFFKANCLNI